MAFTLRGLLFIQVRTNLIQIGELIDSGHVKPIVDTILPLSEASQAYEGAKGIHKSGKIVLRVIG